MQKYNYLPQSILVSHSQSIKVSGGYVEWHEKIASHSNEKIDERLAEINVG